MGNAGSEGFTNTDRSPLMTFLACCFFLRLCLLFVGRAVPAAVGIGNGGRGPPYNTVLPLASSRHSSLCFGSRRPLVRANITKLPSSVGRASCPSSSRSPPQSVYNKSAICFANYDSLYPSNSLPPPESLGHLLPDAFDLVGLQLKRAECIAVCIVAAQIGCSHSTDHLTYPGGHQPRP